MCRVRGAGAGSGSGTGPGGARGAKRRREVRKEAARGGCACKEGRTGRSGRRRTLPVGLLQVRRHAFHGTTHGQCCHCGVPLVQHVRGGWGLQQGGQARSVGTARQAGGSGRQGAASREPPRSQCACNHLFSRLQRAQPVPRKAADGGPTGFPILRRLTLPAFWHLMMECAAKPPLPPSFTASTPPPSPGAAQTACRLTTSVRPQFHIHNGRSS